MVRDWDLIRKILLRLEKEPEQRAAVCDDEFSGYAPAVVSYHIRLLKEAGLIHARCVPDFPNRETCVAQSLTWSGHEFLNQIRNDNVWQQAKQKISDLGLALTFDAVKLAVGKLIESMLD